MKVQNLSASYHSNGTGHWRQKDVMFDALQIMDTVIKVEFALAGNESFAAVAIKQAIRDKKPARVILDTLKDMATDNFNGVADMIGCALTRKILAL